MHCSLPPQISFPFSPSINHFPPSKRPISRPSSPPPYNMHDLPPMTLYPPRVSYWLGWPPSLDSTSESDGPTLTWNWSQNLTALPLYNQPQSLMALHSCSAPQTLWHPHLPKSWLMMLTPRAKLPTLSESHQILAADHATTMDQDRQVQILEEEVKEFLHHLATVVSHI